MQKLELHLYEILRPLNSTTTKEALHTDNFSVFLQLSKLIFFFKMSIPWQSSSFHSDISETFRRLLQYFGIQPQAQLK